MTDRKTEPLTPEELDPDAPSILDAVRAEAWDDGFWACVSDPVPTPKDRPSINPYRARTTDGGGD